MALSIKDPFGGADTLEDSKKQLALLLMKRASAPNPSLGGSVLNGLAMGLMGLSERNDANARSEALGKAIDAMYGQPGMTPPGVSSLEPEKPKPIEPTLAVPPEAFSPSPMQDIPAQLSGGQLPKGGIDRSSLTPQIDDAMTQRLASMVKGEVGLRDPKLAQIQLESALNRTQARDIPLAQALLSVGEDPKRGYYASDTYSRPASPAELESFKTNILGPVLAGSDVGTQTLGFTPTGNASGPYAANRAANGVYANSAWYSGQPLKGEMFAQEKFDAPRIADLPKLASLGPMLGPPQAPSQLQPPMPPVPQAGFTPGPQPNVAELAVRQANLPPSAPMPTQVAQAGGIPPTIPQVPQDPATQRLYQLYQQTNDPRTKQLYGSMLLQQVQKQREMQLQLQMDRAKATNDIKEYEYAKAQGFRGSLADWMASKRAGAGEFGLQPIYGTDANGKTVILQLGKSGTAAQAKIPEGVNISTGIEKIDMGTQYALQDKRSGQIVGYLPKNVREAAAEKEIGTEQGKARQSLPTDILAGEQTVKQIDDLIKHPGLDSIVGPVDQFRPSFTLGAAGRDALARYNQLKGRAFLQAYSTLRGGGQITEVEGAKAENALARMDRAQDEATFRQALGDFRDAVRDGIKKLREKAGIKGPPQNDLKAKYGLD